MKLRGKGVISLFALIPLLASHWFIKELRDRSHVGIPTDKGLSIPPPDRWTYRITAEPNNTTRVPYTLTRVQHITHVLYFIPLCLSRPREPQFTAYLLLHSLVSRIKVISPSSCGKHGHKGSGEPNNRHGKGSSEPSHKDSSFNSNPSQRRRRHSNNPDDDEDEHGSKAKRTSRSPQHTSSSPTRTKTTRRHTTDRPSTTRGEHGHGHTGHGHKRSSGRAHKHSGHSSKRKRVVLKSETEESEDDYNQYDDQQNLYDDEDDQGEDHYGREDDEYYEDSEREQQQDDDEYEDDQMHHKIPEPSSKSKRKAHTLNAKPTHNQVIYFDDPSGIQPLGQSIQPHTVIRNEDLITVDILEGSNDYVEYFHDPSTAIHTFTTRNPYLIIQVNQGENVLWKCSDGHYGDQVTVTVTDDHLLVNVSCPVAQPGQSVHTPITPASSSSPTCTATSTTPTAPNTNSSPISVSTETFISNVDGKKKRVTNMTITRTVRKVNRAVNTNVVEKEDRGVNTDIHYWEVSCKRHSGHRKEGHRQHIDTYEDGHGDHARGHSNRSQSKPSTHVSHTRGHSEGHGNNHQGTRQGHSHRSGNCRGDHDHGHSRGNSGHSGSHGTRNRSNHGHDPTHPQTRHTTKRKAR